ncbi:MAG: hypothetical protein EAZ91_06095 [Cytophagales bacterium]|nr:MAG: hypothetical protein EAZ91_06095 [Cytophagales bacterium]
MKSTFFLSLCFLSIQVSSLFGQSLTLDSPVSRMVFQRGLDNSALVPVRGRIGGQTDRVVGRLVARQGGQTTNWHEGTVQNGAYQLTIPASGGFYDLEVMAMNGTAEGSRLRRERIGVGEVFVVSGQSNNFGEPGKGLPATDDRVSVVNFWPGSEGNLNEQNMPMTFAQAGAGTFCGPRNPLYIWGGLGDRLVAKLGVPVLFLGAAHPGSSTNNWREAAQGMERVTGRDWSNNAPYRPLRITLQQYGKVMGVRSVLWHQGESDNKFQTTDGYVNNMRILINQARSDSRMNNLSWTIARASFYPFYPGHERDPGVIAGQNRVIQSVSNCFSGPYTDAFTGQTYRDDLIHFSEYAYGFLADLWNEHLTPSYFQSAQPSLPSVGNASSVARLDVLSVPIPNNTSPQTDTPAPVTVGTFALTTPTYSCQTGAITFRATAGNGNPVEFFVPGITGWTTNASHTLGEGVRRDAQTLTIFGRQSGVETSLTWNIRGACTGSGPSAPAPPSTPTPPPTSNPPVSNPPPSNGSQSTNGGTVAVIAPAYNCQSGAITFATSGGNGSPVEFMVPGVTGWTTNPSHTLGEGVRRDAQTLTIFARQSGVEVSLNWNKRGFCDGSAPTPPVAQPTPPVTAPPAPTPSTPVSGPLAVLTPEYNCQSGLLTFRTTGGSGSAVEFMAPGVTGWTTNPSHTLGAGVRRDAQTLTLMARQSGIETSLTWNIRATCANTGAARLASSPELPALLRLTVLPNPATERVRVVWPMVLQANWKSRFVNASGTEMPVTTQTTPDGLEADVRNLPTGSYLWQITTEGLPSQTLRVMKVD